jgi:hypothetical protein
MTNREVYKEVEYRISNFYPDYLMHDGFEETIRRCVDVVMFELDLPQGMAVQYVRNVVYSYRPKLEDEDD